MSVEVSAPPAAAAAAAITAATGVDAHDVAVVLGSGWRPAADLIGEPAARDRDGRPARFRSADRRRARRHDPLGACRRAPACSCCSAAPTSTRATASSAVVHGVRTAAPPAAARCVLTNAAGGLREGMQVGDPVLISDHLNLTATLAAGRPALRRPHRPVLPAAARAGPGDRPVAVRGRLRRPARPALRDARRDPDAAHAGRRPGRHVHGARGDRGPRRGRRGVRAVAGHQPGRRDDRRAARTTRRCWPRARRRPAGWATLLRDLVARVA